MNASPVLVDTDVISFLSKDHPFAPEYWRVLEGRELLVSVVSIGEIEYGMEFRRWSDLRRKRIRDLLDTFTPVALDAQTARLWALVKAACERKGRPIAILDGWIAASALRLGVPLVTNNVSDFQPVDNLTVITSSR